jgi:hypothetical protein
MSVKTYLVEEIFSLMLDYEKDLANETLSQNPVKPNDEIIWQENSLSLDKESFEQWLDLYFESLLSGKNR